MLALTSSIEVQFPPVVRFGEGTMNTLASWADQQGYKKSFIVTDAANKSRTDALGLSNPTCFYDFSPEPSIPDLNSAVDSARGCDLVIGFGGGSAMDLAKLVAVMVDSGQAFHDISGPHRAPRRKVGLVQIPTTAGTGSEVGTRALVTDPSTESKVATESLQMLADMAIVDPAMTMTVPPAITAATGVDAMAHCVEAFTSKRAHPIIDRYALQGIELIGKHLGTAIDDGSNAEARTGLALAAFYGGVCLGPVNTSAGHALAYPLGTRFKIPHGAANALIFPYTLAYNAPVSQDKTALILEALGLETSTDETSIRDQCVDLMRRYGLKTKLRDFGIPEADLESMAEEASGIRRLLDFNPREIETKDILKIYKAAY